MYFKLKHEIYVKTTMEILRSRTTYLRITSNSSSFQMQQQKLYTSLKTYDREIRFVDVF